MEHIFTKEEIDKIKNHAFNTWAVLEHYKTVIGIIIRNMYFKEKSINLSDLDKDTIK